MSDASHVADDPSTNPPHMISFDLNFALTLPGSEFYL